ncbi:MAG: glycerol-3-phosphate dehydrogenase [Rhizobiales bacterium TMED249]|uniref:Glycerol-3-phosphate dehydrogenase n=1 Tax=PS1 clade bacterium TaxID=2175152 RepID=A0A368E3I8_9PROT|nr:MAG: glycerol-3-phosphate dehydrogenase [Rhizobiales bacterium TMED249]RCL78454.1 MAG: glycerol-3-phosphate dehydrogenase [PS1 clade bacterium]HCV49087.1 glycerol-3-phosphate dehydrogenase [Rhodobiaceae bacterium]|tara:strand:- start:41407 stop:42759 length:1353 start_codon:yes stop_codon:yes gene_type:complete
MKEGSTEAPIRYPLDWHSEEFYDRAALDEEARRQYDVCHGCRRCFNLCDSFPRLFDLIDESESGELDTVSSDDFGPIIDGCTMCDMCFMTKCPYVPPHEFNLDFPHLMLRYRAVELKEKGKAPFTQNQLAQMDRNGSLAEKVSGLANWGSSKGNALTRPVMSATLGIDKNVELPKFTGETFMKRAEKSAKNGELEPNKEGTAQDRKALIYATCSVNYNNPGVGEAALKVLTHLGVSVKTDYPGCCGMPYLEQGNLEKVAQNAASVSAALRPYIDEGYDILTLTASCGLMFKFEWPLIVPDNEDVKALSAATRDISEYIVQIADKHGLPDGLQTIEGGVQVHLACHARAQNMGPKSADLLRLIPDADIGVIERCSGHGGTFGVMKDTHELAVKVGKPVARNVAKSEAKTIVSDCPLAAKHIVQGVEYLDSSAKLPEAAHPVEVFARAYGLL